VLASCTTSGTSDNTKNAGDNTKTAGIGCGGLVALEIVVGNVSQAAAAACGVGAIAMDKLLDEREQQALADARLRALQTNQPVDVSVPPENQVADSRAATETGESTSAEPQPPSASDASTTKNPETAPPQTNENAGAQTKPVSEPHKKSIKKKGTSISVAIKERLPDKTGHTCQVQLAHADKGAKEANEESSWCISGAGLLVPYSG
jgi:Tfp pilus assembly protein PilW